MEISFNPMSDDRYASLDPILLLIGNTVHEASYESGRNQFYLYNKYEDDRSEYDILPWDDERIKGWAPSRLREDA